MNLNELSPAPGSKKAAKRVGRGIGSGLGKTCGSGHKGQKSRSGGTVKPGFEGGQMPLQKRVPKFGFTSRKSLVHQKVRVSELSGLTDGVVTIEALKSAGIIKKTTKSVKIYLSGELSRAVSLVVSPNLLISGGAKAVILSAGGSVEEASAA